MQVKAFDHIVLCVADIARACRFYERVLGMEPREEKPGKWSLHFGASKISLQGAANAPDLAKGTLPGSGNFCVLTDVPLDDFVSLLEEQDVEILAGPRELFGATGMIRSVHFRDPDGNLVEVANKV